MAERHLMRATPNNERKRNYKQENYFWMTSQIAKM